MITVRYSWRDHLHAAAAAGVRVSLPPAPPSTVQTMMDTTACPSTIFSLHRLTGLHLFNQWAGQVPPHLTREPRGGEDMLDDASQSMMF